jgi:carbamoylphosphate synthase small subunit
MSDLLNELNNFLIIDMEEKNYRSTQVQSCTKFGQNPLKDVDSRVFTRMLRKDGSVTISLRNFVGERIIKIKQHEP